jgi:hypothetical protein
LTAAWAAVVFIRKEPRGLAQDLCRARIEMEKDRPEAARLRDELAQNRNAKPIESRRPRSLTRTRESIDVAAHQFAAAFGPCRQA